MIGFTIVSTQSCKQLKKLLTDLCATVLNQWQRSSIVSTHRVSGSAVSRLAGAVPNACECYLVMLRYRYTIDLKHGPYEWTVRRRAKHFSKLDSELRLWSFRSRFVLLTAVALCLVRSCRHCYRVAHWELWLPLSCGHTYKHAHACKGKGVRIYLCW